MRRLIVLFGCIFLLLGGCQKPAVNQNGSRLSRDESTVDVIIEDGGEFPQFLVGRWKDRERNWEFVFEPNGTISFVLMGPIQKEMRPGQVTTVETIKGGKGVYEPGDWMVDYSPTSRELTVMVSLKHFYFEWGDELLEGDCIDVFAGPISQDGNIWRVEWTSFPHYIASTPQYPHFEITKDLMGDEGITTTLVFEKIAPNALIFEKIVPHKVIRKPGPHTE